MRLGGLLKFTLIDYPGKVAAVIFTQGCNYRCSFCHNPELVLPDRYLAPLNEEDVFSFLEKRRGQLEGVVITGGEPTIHQDLPQFIKRIKDLGYKVKLDTNGSNPKMIKELSSAGLVDYWAMDIKSALSRYQEAAGVNVDLDAVKDSVELIKSSGAGHEFRTTAVRSILSEQDLREIIAWLGAGQSHYIKRGNLKDKILDPALVDRPDYTDDEWNRLKLVGKAV